MGARRTARERALQALYQLEMTDGQADAALAAAWAASAEGDNPRERVSVAKLQGGAIYKSPANRTAVVRPPH